MGLPQSKVLSANTPRLGRGNFGSNPNRLTIFLTSNKKGIIMAIKAKPSKKKPSSKKK